jgi:hypothetical protein
MRTLANFALTIGASALFAGCDGSQPPIGPPRATPQSRAIAQHASQGGSWMLPEPASEDLLYVLQASAVNIYSLKTGKLVGALTGFYYSRGLCVDNEQDVWVTQETRTDASTITEFAHGKKKPLRVLQDNAGFAYTCAVDPTTDNLTIVNELELTRFRGVFPPCGEGPHHGKKPSLPPGVSG